MKTPIIAALCAIVVLAPHTRLSAEEEEASPAFRLLEKMEFEKTAIESACGIFSDPAMFKGIAEIYERNFTHAELEDLIVFYDSPLGRKLIAAQPAIAQATAELTMKATAENQEIFQQELMKIMEKHEGGAADADE